MWQARGHSLVLYGERDLAAQLLCNFINDLLGNYGHTLDLAAPSLQKQGDDRALAELERELSDGKVGALFIAGVNPVYDLLRGAAFAKSLAQVGLAVNFSQSADETSARAHIVCAEHHEFESWSDAEPVSGIVGVRQRG
jgi:molybdopterin-containing oxidoreductase family iron-sulfur binding subunit